MGVIQGAGVSIKMSGVFLVMQWLFILMASFSAAVPLQDAAEPHSDKLPSLSDLAPIGSNSEIPNFLAFDSEANSESNPETDPGTLKISTQSSDNPAFNLNALGSSLPSALLQSAPPLDLASNSRIPEVDGDENRIDVNPGTVAQNSVSSCASDGTQATKRDKKMQCDNIDLNYFIRPPQANHNSVQTTTGETPTSETPTGEKPGDSELLERKTKDLQWLDEHPDAVVSEDIESLCAAIIDMYPRLLPLCCGWVIAFYSIESWGPDITDEGGCVLNILGRPWCESWKRRVCCQTATYAGDDTGNTLEWGWDGINCAPAH